MQLSATEGAVHRCRHEHSILTMHVDAISPLMMIMANAAMAGQHSLTPSSVIFSVLQQPTQLLLYMPRHLVFNEALPDSLATENFQVASRCRRAGFFPGQYPYAVGHVTCYSIHPKINY